MYKSIKKYDNKKMPFILNIFNNELLIKLGNEDFKNMEKKLVRIDRDDIIPSELKDIILKNI
jgi:hypothetical protein